MVEGLSFPDWDIKGAFEAMEAVERKGPKHGDDESDLLRMSAFWNYLKADRASLPIQNYDE